MRGVPTEKATDGALPLSLADAVNRGLAHNLAALLQEQQVNAATSAGRDALSAVLPHISVAMRQSRQTTNLAAFGFTGFGGLPNLVGPFGVFDARLSLSTPLFDASAFGALRAERALSDAAHADYRQVREAVILTVGDAYLEAVADQARVVAARAERDTAETLARLADDQKTAGLIAQIDVLRQQVQVQAARARLIAIENEYAKQKLALGRAIGLPANQTIELTTTADYAPAPEITLAQATVVARAHRDDLAAARSRVEAASAARQAISNSRLPTLHLDADVGELGSSARTAERTYTLAANLRVPIFEGGRTQARVAESTAQLKAREAELADLESGIEYDISAALLDVRAATAGVEVARAGRDLAAEELTQAQDRFRAGVASSLELVQAQDAVARATEQYIASVYAHNIAKATLAHAMGEVEERFVELVGGTR